MTFPSPASYSGILTPLDSMVSMGHLAAFVFIPFLLPFCYLWVKRQLFLCNIHGFKSRMRWNPLIARFALKTALMKSLRAFVLQFSPFFAESLSADFAHSKWMSISSTVEKCSILTMTEHERAKQRDEIQTAFENGTVFSATEETLLTYLKSLCSEDVLNETVRHRKLLRGILSGSTSAPG